MSLPKINSRFLLIIFLLFSNFWIYRIFKTDLLIGLVIVLTTLLISLFWEKKKSFKVIFVCMLVLLLFQYKTTQTQSLTLLDNDQQRVQQERIRSYPPTYINLFFKTIWLKPESWIEQNDLVIALSRIEENLFDNLNLNKYFFGGFPRNKPTDFEKLTFFLIPLFIIGVYRIVKEKKYGVFVLVFIIPLTTLSIIGNRNNLGPFVLFPGFFISFIAGIKFMENYFRNRKLLYGTIVLLGMLGFILQISYAKI